MNKVAFIFSGYSKDLIFSNDPSIDYNAHKKKILNILSCMENNIKCKHVLSGALEECKNIEQCGLILNVALANSLIFEGIKPDYIAGFSVGDIHALNFSGSVSLECAIKTLYYRDRIYVTDKVLKSLSMVLIEGIDYSLAEILISKYKNSCPICYNTNKDIIVLVQDRFEKNLAHDVKYVGGKTTPLNKNVAYSLPFVDLKNTELFMYLKNYDYSQPSVATYLNSSLFNPSESAALNICNAFTEPIVFSKEIKNFVDRDVNLFIEIGGDGLLTNYIKTLAPNANVYSVNDLKSVYYVAQRLLMPV